MRADLHELVWITPSGDRTEEVCRYRADDGFGIVIATAHPDHRLVAERLYRFALDLPSVMRGHWPQIVVSALLSEELHGDRALARAVDGRLILYRDAIDSLEVTVAHELAHLLNGDGASPKELRDRWTLAIASDTASALSSEHPLLHPTAGEPETLRIGGIHRQLVPQLSAVTNYAYTAGEHRAAEEWAESVSLFLLSETSDGLVEHGGDIVRFEDLYPARHGVLMEWATGDSLALAA